MAKFADVDIDMDEWEVLVPGDVASPLFSDELHFNPGEVIRMDHFTCPPDMDTKHHVLEKKKNSNEEEAAAAAAAAEAPPPPPHVVEFKDTTNIPELSIPHPVILPKLMDMESPKSLLKNNEEEKEEEEEEEEEESTAAEGKKHKAAAAAAAAAAACCDVNILGWRVSGGISALCSIGVAAATICMFILGGQQQRQQQQQQQQRHQNQRHQFQQHTDDKRMEQLMQQATRLNQALSVVRGVPMTRAHISFGGYYDGL